MKGPHLKNALAFAGYLVKEAETEGKEKALELKTPFDEVELMQQNKDFVFENMNSIKQVQVLINTDESVKVEGDKNLREAAQPRKPATFFY